MALVSRAEVVHNLNKMLLWNSGNGVRTTWQHRAPCPSALTAQAGSLPQVRRAACFSLLFLLLLSNFLEKPLASLRHLWLPDQGRTASIWWLDDGICNTPLSVPGSKLPLVTLQRGVLWSYSLIIKHYGPLSGFPLSQNNQDCLQSLSTISKEIILGVTPS